jgi:peptide/nickel transport system substrate-binding protein
MMKHRRILATAVAVATTVALAGCSSSDEGGKGKGQTSQDLSSQYQINELSYDDLKDGGTLTTAVPEITPQFNTFQSDGTLYTLNFWRWYNPQVMLFDPDGTAHVDPDYVTGYDKAEKDGKTVVTYTINEKATYNDGSPIDWKSWEATWKANRSDSEGFLPSSTDGYSQIESVERGKDDKQAVVTFKGVYAWVDGLFNVLLNPKAATPDVYNKGYINNPHPEWGAGPYTLDKLDKKNGTISFKPNPKWWGDDKAKLEKRTFKALEDTASINAFKAGQLDATSVASKDRLAQVKGMKDIDLRRSATPSQNLLTLNAQHANLKDLDVRKAVFMGIDRKVLGEIEFQGLDYTEEPPGSFTLYPFQKGYVDNLAEAGYKYDTKAAGDLLDQAGWKMGSGEYRQKGGKNLTLAYAVIGDDPTTQAQAKATVSMLKEIGIEVKIEQHPSSDFSDVFLKGQFDIFGLGFSSSDPFGFAYFCQIWCSNSGLNVSHTGTKELDAKIKELEKVGDAEQQIEQGNKLEQEIMSKTYGIMPTTNGPTIVATKKGLANYGAGLFYVGRVQDVGWQK